MTFASKMHIKLMLGAFLALFFIPNGELCSGHSKPGTLKHNNQGCILTLLQRQALIQTLSKCNISSCIDNCESCPELLKLRDDVEKLKEFGKLLEDDNASLKDDVAKLKEAGSLQVLYIIVILFTL